MVTVTLKSELITITSTESLSNAEITINSYNAISDSGKVHGTGFLPMYDKAAGKLNPITLSYDPKNSKSALWLIRAINFDTGGRINYWA